MSKPLTPVNGNAVIVVVTETVVVATGLPPPSRYPSKRKLEAPPARSEMLSKSNSDPSLLVIVASVMVPEVLVNSQKLLTTRYRPVVAVAEKDNSCEPSKLEISTEVEPVKLVSPGQVPESKLMVVPVGAVEPPEAGKAVPEIATLYVVKVAIDTN